MAGVVLVGLPSEVESQVRYALSGQVLVSAGSLDQAPEGPSPVILWVGTAEAWTGALAWAARQPVERRRIALVAHACAATLDPFSAPAARQAGLEAWVPVSPADLPLVLSQDRHWWAPSGSREAVEAAGVQVVEREKVVERVVERVRDRMLPTASHPALIVCASPVPGAGTTTLAAALSGWLSRRGLETVLVGIRRQYAEQQDPQGDARGRYRAGIEALADGRRVPRSVTMVTADGADGVREALRARRAPYVVADCPAPLPPGRWPKPAADADAILGLLPARAAQVGEWFAPWRDAGGMLSRDGDGREPRVRWLVGVHDHDARVTAAQVQAVLWPRSAEAPAREPQVGVVPDLGVVLGTREWPGTTEDRRLDVLLGGALSGLLPAESGPKRGRRR